MNSTDFSYITALQIFICYFIIDALYSYYIICVNEGKALRGAVTTSVIYSLLAYGVISYSENVYYLIPLASGAFCGTFFMIKIKTLYNPTEKGVSDESRPNLQKEKKAG
jgi:hypothetical protein